MAYVQVAQSVTRHRKTLRLARLLNMDRYQVVGRLVELWSWCLDNAPRGCLADVEPDILADVLDYDGKPAELEEALISSGFLDVGEDGHLWVHGWDETMLPYIDRKEKNAQRMRETRAREREDREEAEAAGNAASSASGASGDRKRAMHVQRTLAARADVEKKREEKSISSSTGTSDGEDTSQERMAPALSLGALALVPSPAAVASVSTVISPAPSPAPSPSSSPQPPKLVPLQPPKPANPAVSMTRPARTPDLLWDACVAACGGIAPSNKVERGKWNKGVAALRESGATPDEITIRAGRYKRRYGERIALNPMALAGNWTQLATDITATEVTSHANSHTRHNQHNGNFTRSNDQRRRGATQAYNPQLPSAEDIREWARQERAAGRPVIGG